MYRDGAQWSSIRYRILEQNMPIRQVVRETGISRTTVRKMLRHPFPQRYRLGGRAQPKLGPHTASIRRLLEENATLPPSARLSVQAIYERLRDDEGFAGAYSTVTDYARFVMPDRGCIWEHAYDLLISLEKKRATDFLFLLSSIDAPALSPGRTERFFRQPGPLVGVSKKSDSRTQAQQTAFAWMHAVLQNRISGDVLCREAAEVAGFDSLLQHLYEGRLSDRNRALVVLASRHGLSKRVICRFLGIGRNTCRKYLRIFEEAGCKGLFARQTKSTRKSHSEAVKQAVFGLLHEPPSNYGINRTTWIMADLVRVMGETGHPACSHVIRKITKAAGYRWRKARVVLTSADPDYSEKLAHIQAILSGLAPDEAFFSIDEFGPFAVKTKPGRVLSAPGEQRIVPQWQKSRGCLIVTAALELSCNQVTHFYSAKKNTAEMLRMMELLVEKYSSHRKLYLSWDAASWHISKRLHHRVEEHNAAAVGSGKPTVETAPLPSGAQFLNVIESVFSGMARAIIHNSDYRTLDDAKTAIDRYFANRNAHFVQNPRRAGRKIWGNERVLAEFSGANNCKDPRYR